MTHGIFQKFSGVKGRLTIPALGALIGTTSQWELRRRGGDDDPLAGTYDLRAVFSYLNEHLYNDEDYTKEFIITLGRTKQLRVTQTDGQRTVLRGMTLLMEGVKIHGLEGSDR